MCVITNKYFPPQIQYATNKKDKSVGLFGPAIHELGLVWWGKISVGQFGASVHELGLVCGGGRVEVELLTMWSKHK